MQTLTLLLVTLPISACFVGSIKANILEDVGTWKKIDLYLKGATVEHEAEKNMAKALERLEEIRSGSLTVIFLLNKKKITEALEVLEDLKFMLDYHVCTKNSIDLRKALIKTALDSRNEWWRFSIIVFEYSEKLSEICQEEYVVIYRNQLKRFMSRAPAAIEQTRPFFMKIIHFWIEGHILPNPSYQDYLSWAKGSRVRDEIHDKFIMAVPILESEKDAAIAYEAIENLAKKNLNSELVDKDTNIVDGKVVITGRQAKELFSKLIVASCETYLNYLGPNVFDLAQVEINFRSIRANPPYLHDRTYSDYFLEWAQYKMCKTLVSYKLLAGKFLERIQVVADKQATDSTS